MMHREVRHPISLRMAAAMVSMVMAVSRSLACCHLMPVHTVDAFSLRHGMAILAGAFQALLLKNLECVLLVCRQLD